MSGAHLACPPDCYIYVLLRMLAGRPPVGQWVVSATDDKSPPVGRTPRHGRLSEGVTSPRLAELTYKLYLRTFGLKRTAEAQLANLLHSISTHAGQGCVRCGTLSSVFGLSVFGLSVTTNFSEQESHLVYTAYSEFSVNSSMEQKQYGEQ